MTCSLLTVGLSKLSAMEPALVRTRLRGGAKGSSTSRAFLFMFNSAGLIVKMFFFSPPASSPAAASSRNIFSTVSLAFLSVIP